MTAITLSPPRLGASYKFIWGLAALGTSLISGTFGALLPIFYQDYLGLRPAGSPVASVIYAIWNAINDPLFGYITDSTRSKRGRRIPYMRFTAPFLALTFILVWFAPQGRRTARPLLLDAWHHAALRHLLHHHRAGLFRPAARGDRVGRRAQRPADILIALRPAGHAARLHHPRFVPAQGRHLARPSSRCRSR